MDLARYTALFLADSREQLRRSSALLLEWEREPDTVEPVAELFRAFHTIKGSAATMGYSAVADLAHQAENLLDAVRRRELTGSPAVIGLLLRAVDQLEQGIEVAVAGGDGFEAGPLTEAIGRLARSATPSTVRAGRSPTGNGDHLPPATARPSGRFVVPKPTAAARIEPARLDELLQQAGELVVTRNRLAALSARRRDPELEAVAGRLDSLVRTLHGGVVRVRLAPLSDLFDRFPRVVRDLGASLGKPVRLELSDGGIELDRSVLEELVEPLIHLLRNAVDHGIEAPTQRTALGKPPEGRLVLAAERRRDWVVLRLSDDGRGIDPGRVRERAVELGQLPPGDRLNNDQLLAVLARPGFSLKREVTAVSGRGVGMDAVTTKLRALGGGLELITEPGRGTTFELSVPMTTAIQRVLLVGIDRERYAIPFRLIREAVRPAGAAGGGQGPFTFRGRALALVDLARAVGTPGRADPASRPVLVLEWGTRDGALVVDTVLGQHDILIERVEAPVGMPGWVSGATILADGLPAFVLDPTALF